MPIKNSVLARQEECCGYSAGPYLYFRKRILQMIVKIDCDKNEIKKLEGFDYSMMFAYPEIQSILVKVYKAIDKQRNMSKNSAKSNQ